MNIQSNVAVDLSSWVDWILSGWYDSTIYTLYGYLGNIDDDVIGRSSAYVSALNPVVVELTLRFTPVRKVKFRCLSLTQMCQIYAELYVFRFRCCNGFHFQKWGLI
jgi:hypothetical protein